jgi:hypothetical protein
MPRFYRTQKEVEQFLIREFVACLGYSVSCPRWQDRPDALLTLSKHGRRKRVAVEHTEYFNDTVAGQRSPVTPIEEFWRAVQASLVRRISHRAHLSGIVANVELKKDRSIPWDSRRFARQVAAELVAFAEAHPVAKSENLSFHCGDFDGYPTLGSLLSCLWLLRGTTDAVGASRLSWICSDLNTGRIGLSLRYIKSAIRRKNEKTAKYKNWSDAREKWLLIAASGDTVSNQAGPPEQDADWADRDLATLCRESLFDRIVFWERPRCWYKWLKPCQEVVQYRDPYVGR